MKKNEQLTVELHYKSNTGELWEIKLFNPKKIKLKNNKYVWYGQEKIGKQLINRSIHSDDLIATDNRF